MPITISPADVVHVAPEELLYLKDFLSRSNEANVTLNSRFVLDMIDLLPKEAYQEDFYEAARNDPDMTEQQKQFWLSKQPKTNAPEMEAVPAGTTAHKVKAFDNLRSDLHKTEAELERLKRLHQSKMTLAKMVIAALIDDSPDDTAAVEAMVAYVAEQAAKQLHAAHTELENGTAIASAVTAERERCACLSLTTVVPYASELDNPFALLAHAIADRINAGEPCKLL